MNYKIGSTITYVGKKYDSLLYKNQQYIVSSHTITTKGILLQLKGHEDFFIADQFIGAQFSFSIAEIRKNLLQEYEDKKMVYLQFEEIKKNFPNDKSAFFTDLKKTSLYKSSPKHNKKKI